MPMPAPVLDDRTFQDIVNECRRRIPELCPEWTDHNLSDPGITLIELFAWMTELLLYRLNRVPERNYLKFLELMGLELEPPRAAQTDIVFRLTSPQPDTVRIPQGSEVATVRTETEEAISFTTEEDLRIHVPSLVYSYIEAGQGSLRDYMPALQNPALEVDIFQPVPQTEDAFYLGYRQDLRAHTLALTVECQIEGVGVDPRRPPLAWEGWDRARRRWQPLTVESDSTGGLNRTGQVILQLPYRAGMTQLEAKRAFWIRCRVTPEAPRQPRYRRSPQVKRVATESIGGMVRASHSVRLEDELVGQSDGEPGQVLRLQRTPVLPRRPQERVVVETEDRAFEEWLEVESLGSSGPDDPHYLLDGNTGELRFGPRLRTPEGQERQFGRVPPLGRQIRMRAYRSGGGRVGNVGQRTLTVLKSSIPYVAAVYNPSAAEGGLDAESVEHAKVRGPEVLKARQRAVTAEDFEFHALRAGRVARALCLFPRGGDGNGVRPGVVKLMLLPEVAPPHDRRLAPEELVLSEELQEAVRRYLDERRLLAAELVLESPPLQFVTVWADVEPHRRADPVRVQEGVEAALYRFVNPLTGGAEARGWPFGRPLHLSEIYSVIQQVEGVEFVEAAQLYAVGPDGRTQEPVNRIELAEHGLVVSHTHRVRV